MIKSGTGYFHAAAEVVSPRTAIDGGVRCPCCDSMSLKEPGGYEICPICGWEDNPVQEAHPDLTIGANGASLNESRAEWARLRHKTTR